MSKREKAGLERRAVAGRRSRAAAVLSGCLILIGASQTIAAPSTDDRRAELKLVASPYVCDADDQRETERPPVVEHPDRERAVRMGTGDMAFSGDLAIVLCGADSGALADDGFAAVDISNPRKPALLSTFPCVASASDVAMYGDLVFLAVDRNNDTAVLRGPLGDDEAAALGKPTGCDAPIVQRASVVNSIAPPPAVAATGKADTVFAGIRVVSVADPRNPTLVTSVDFGEYSAGAHTVTAVPELDRGRVLVYASSPGPANTKVVAVPLDAPETAEVLPVKVDTTAGCHDISFFLPRGLMACNRHGSGTLLLDVRDDPDDAFDDGASISNPMRIVRRDANGNEVKRGVAFDHPGPLPGFLPLDVCRESPRGIDGICPVQSGPSQHHSSAFSWDGKTLVVSDEAFATTAYSREKGCPRGKADPSDKNDKGHFGSVFFYDISDPAEPQLRSYHAPPPVDNGFCRSKQLNVIPLPDGRDVVVVAWIGGGTSVIDFTDPARPYELGHYVDGVGTSNRVGVWASYFYNGYIYANNGYGCYLATFCEGSFTRGLDVLAARGNGLGEALHLPSFDFGRQECPPGATAEAMPDCVTEQTP